MRKTLVAAMVAAGMLASGLAMAQNAAPKPQFKFKFNFDGGAKKAVPASKKASSAPKKTRPAVVKVPKADKEVYVPVKIEATAPDVREPASPKAPEAPRAPASDAFADQTVGVIFAPGETVLTHDDKAAIDAFASAIRDRDDVNVKIMGYASAEASDSPHKARQISLTRALAVRSYLLHDGIGNFKIEVRALGNASTDDVKDKVEIIAGRR